MGSGDNGPYGIGDTVGGGSPHSFGDNESKLIDEFSIDDEGLFGHEGHSAGVRQIGSEDPLETCEEFAEIAAQGGTIKHELPNGGWVAQLEDGSYVTYRPISTTGSPAVDLNLVDSTQVQSQKIHFEEE